LPAYQKMNPAFLSVMETAGVSTNALDIPNGKISLTEQAPTMIDKPVSLFDRRQIQKWSGKASELPEESTFIRRDSSLWDRYAWHMRGFLGLLPGRLLITSLLVHRRRRERSEQELEELNKTLEQRVAERATELQESEARYRSLFNSMTEGFALHEIITDADGKPCDYRFLETNPAFERLTGLSREAVIGKTVREVIPNVETYWIKTFGRVALEGTPTHIENYSAPLNRWYEVVAYRTAPNQFAVLFMDVSERKKADKALRQSREDLDRAQEVGQIGSWRLDVLRNVLTWSEETYRIFGVPKGTDLSYETFLGFIHPDDRRQVDTEWKAALRGAPYDIEHRIIVAGEVRWVREKAYLEFDEAGGLIGGFGITQDITDRMRAELDLREREENLRASLDEKEVLLKEIHHRVKNNLQVISSLVGLQAEELRDHAMRDVLQDVTHRVRSMAMVHEKLYQSSDLARVQFADYAQDLLHYLWRSHGSDAAGVRLALNLEPVSLSVNAAVPCGLILNELFSNALKHAFDGRDGGQVNVSLRCDAQGRVRLRVRDNGRGLPARFDWTQSRSLGLRLVQMLAKQLHAVVEVFSLKGTEFTVTFGEPKT